VSGVFFEYVADRGRSEYLHKSEDFRPSNPFHPRKKIKFYDLHWNQQSAAPEALRELQQEGGFVLCWVPVLKNDKNGAVYGDFPTPFPIGPPGPERFIDAARWLIHMKLNDPMPDPSQRRITPMFTDRATGRQLTVDKFDLTNKKELPASLQRKGKALTPAALNELYSPTASGSAGEMLTRQQGRP